MKTELIEKAYAIARERYAGIGVDTEQALAALQNISLSLHCWQADDVTGFENRGGDLTGGIQATGNYPGKARNIEELRADILKAKSFIPGTHRLNLHEIYGEFGGETVDRDQVEPRHFQGWIEWAKEHGMKLDFNSTSFSHPKSGDLSLANPDPGIRDFWVEHTKRCRAIAEEMGKAQGDPSIMNLWVHDGSKDLTVNRMLYRELLRDSLDRIFETEYDHMKDCIESKVFGIGLESYTVGSNDFYIGYGASRGKIVTLDTGHFHPTEIVADKISSLLLFIPEVMLHVSRPVRWDSDHVTIMNDDTLELCKEIVRCDALDRVHIGLDYFDASINRIGAYVIGSRATQKCLMQALLEPLAQLRRYEVHDGSKDLTVNRMLYRELLRDSLDRIFETEYDHMKDCIESKVFGIGLESYTVGSNDFYIGYGASRGKIVTLDTGHFHPTEIVADKISSLLLFIPEVMLHVSRPVRWDSDHVTIMNDDTLELCKEIVRCDALDRVHIGLDYFDASINRIGAYVIGSRATQKCLMQALLEPLAQLRRYEAAGQGFERLALLEESKSLPWNAVWDMFCLRNDVPVGEEFIAGIQQYEREVTSKR